VRPPNTCITNTHSYFTYFVKVTNGKRDELAHYLLSHGIYNTVRYHPLHLIDRYRKGHRLPVAEKLNNELINLPLHPRLTDKDVEYIIDTIKGFK
jgi:dTDP-4-amino-4,6-dideoxygalactose transaminase